MRRIEMFIKIKEIIFSKELMKSSKIKMRYRN